MSKEQHNLPLNPGAPEGLAVRVCCDTGKLGWLAPAGRAMPLCSFIEQTPYEVLVEGLGGRLVRVWLAGEERTRELHRVGGGAYWALNWGDFAGLSRLRLEADGQTVLDLPVEVRSRKVNYSEHYRLLLDELAEWLVALAFSVQAPAMLPTLVQAAAPTSPYLAYLVLRYLMDPLRLPAAFAQVVADPHRRLVREHVRVDISQACSLTFHTLTDIVSGKGEILRAPAGVLTTEVAQHLRGCVPTHLLDARAHTDVDTPENRFVRHVLDQLGWELARLQRAFTQDAAIHAARLDQAYAIARDCEMWGRQVARWQRARFLEEVGPMRFFPVASQVLRHRAGYREMRDFYFRLLLCPRVRWEGLEKLLQVPAKDVPSLYEYWCFFALADSLSRVIGSHAEWGDLVRWKDGLWELCLKQGEDAHVRCGPVTLAFNRRYGRHSGKSYSLSLRPDFTVEVAGHVWLFDAKYRLESADIIEVQNSEDDEEAVLPPDAGEGERDARSTFKRADIYKMHTYRDAIEGAEAVFVLYPGDRFAAFSADRQPCAGPDSLPLGFTGVGAIPLLPGKTAELEAVLRALLTEANPT